MILQPLLQLFFLSVTFYMYVARGYSKFRKWLENNEYDMHTKWRFITWPVVSSLERRCFSKADNQPRFLSWRKARQDSFNLSSFIIQRSKTRSLRDVYLTKGRSCAISRYFVIPAFLFEIHLRWLGNEVPGKLKSVSFMRYCILKFLPFYNFIKFPLILLIFQMIFR